MEAHAGERHLNMLVPVRPLENIKAALWTKGVRAIFWPGGRGTVNHLPKKLSQVAKFFYETAEKTPTKEVKYSYI